MMLSPFASHATEPATLDSIRHAKVLTCGVNQSEAEYSTEDEHGSRVAFDRDLCNAVAVAILGQHAAFAVKGYPDNDTAIAALKRREVDLVATVSDDFSHATIAGVSLTQPVLIDGEGFMVARASRVTRAAQLRGRKVCFLDQSETEINLHRWFAARRLDFVPFPFQEEGEMEAAFVTKNCTALAGDMTRLANARATFGARKDDYVLLPDAIALDPLAMAYRSDDVAFGNVVRWTFDVLVEAEELGVSSTNVDQMLAGNDPGIMRLLGTSHELARKLSLAEDWTVNLLRATGNYGEIYARDLGEGSPLKMIRGANNLWTHQGLIYAAPLK